MSGVVAPRLPSPWGGVGGGGSASPAGAVHPPPAPPSREGGSGACGRGLRFAGYAALFGTPDAARDTILPGAFAATLTARGTPLPLYWQHRPTQRIGWVEHASEDARGLRIIATLDAPHSRAAALLARRQVDGLSFGYRARAYRLTPAGRILAEIELLEVSLVTHPLQHGARVHFITC
jgi:HK97 family phage prohead protease